MSASAAPRPHPADPVDPQKRIEAIDMVRGFALFGVLLVNMFNFGANSIIWTAPADQVAYLAKVSFFETKSWRLFSLLFGLGFTLQLLRAEMRGGRFIPTYLRRLAILFVIGMVHALFYALDILMLYAELGLILILFRKARPRLLLVLAVALLAINPLANVVVSLTSDGPPATPDFEVRLEEERREIDELLRTHPVVVGSVPEMMAWNARYAIPPNPLRDPLGRESHMAVFAMFLLGLYAGRRRIFNDVERHLLFIRRVFWWGLSIGGASMAMVLVLTLAARRGYELPLGRGWNSLVELVGSVAYVYGSTALCLGYAAAIVLLSRKVRFTWLVKPLAPVGRLALTVYLSQTLVLCTLFYGFGFGQAFRMRPVVVAACAVLIFAAQVVACGWWVRRYRFGPVEWLWRGLTYLAFPPMKLQASPRGSE